MKYKLLSLMAIIIIGISTPVIAAFPVKHIPARENVSISKIADHEHMPVIAGVYDKASHFADNVARVLHSHNNILPERRKTDTLGLLSLIFGIVGIVTISFGGTFLSIAAIVLGAIGVNHHERFSLAGLILGIVGVALLIIAVILVVAVLSSLL